MRETNIYHAIHTGVMDLKFCGADFNPDIGSLAWEILISKRYGGTIILPSSNEKGFEIIKYSALDVEIKDDGVTVDDLLGMHKRTLWFNSGGRDYWRC